MVGTAMGIPEEDEKGEEFYEVEKGANGRLKFRSPARGGNAAKLAERICGIESAKMDFGRAAEFGPMQDYARKKLSFGPKKSVS